MNAMVEPTKFSEQPLFRSAHGALTFAFNYVHGSVKKPFLATLMGGSRTGRGLGGLDGAGQAGMIRAEVDQLEPARRRVLLLRYAPARAPCACKAPCCAGFRINPEWGSAVDWLAMHVLKTALVGKVSNYKLRQALVCRFFEPEKRSMVKISEECRVKRDTAAEHNKLVVAYFEEEEKVAEREIYGRLYDAGMIES